MKSDDVTWLDPVMARETRPSVRSGEERSLAGSMAIAWIWAIASGSSARVAALAVMARTAVLSPVFMFEADSPVVAVNLEINSELMD